MSGTSRSDADAPAADARQMIGDKALKNFVQIGRVFHYQHQIADNKAAAIFSINTLLLGALAFSRLVRSGSNIIAPENASALLSLIILGALLLSIAWSTFCVLMTIYPRRQARAQSAVFPVASSEESPVPEFVARTLLLSNEAMAQEIAKLIHADARISIFKYRWVNRAGTGLGFALLDWLLLHAISLVG
ncbi:MAG: hypothetical protein L6Q98_16050 [Anaerolineae bacterium]|nr:hypothetical protein [Anaerolineae bacterium]NUQ05997.1 hypothetical protein [Anaerolineae bacterium]